MECVAGFQFAAELGAPSLLTLLPSDPSAFLGLPVVHAGLACVTRRAKQLPVFEAMGAERIEPLNMVDSVVPERDFLAAQGAPRLAFDEHSSDIARREAFAFGRFGKGIAVAH